MRLFAELGIDDEAAAVRARAASSLEVQELADHERPPMIRIPEYLEKRRAGRGRPRPTDVADRQLRVLIAPDSFKGSLTSVQVARALADGLAPRAPGRRPPPRAARRRRRGDAGRDRGRRRLAVARGRRAPTRSGARSAPAGSGARTAGAAVVEMAAASGPVARRRRRSATRRARRARAPATCCGPCSTRGSATSRSGIGGSATTDGGAGLLRSLGAEVSDDLATVDLDGLDAAPVARRGSGSPAT